MFIFSFKTSKLKLAAALLAVAVTVSLLVSSALNAASPALAPRGINLAAQDSRQRLDFLAQFGWEVNEDPIEVGEIIIPQEFNAVYRSYNELQLEQGFDLAAYSGKRVKRWTYTVTNYPGYDETTDCIHANILVCDGAVIGGDICNVELGGFMHGFAMQSMPETTREQTDEPETAQTTEQAASDNGD